MTADVALLVVHGMGAQAPGEPLQKLARGLRRIAPDSVPRDARDGMVVTIGGQAVRLYEVYWADLLMGDVSRGAFRMNELQSIAWFPWFNNRRGNYRRGSYSFLRLAWWCIVLPVVNFLVLFAYYGAVFFAQALAGSWDGGGVPRSSRLRRRSSWSGSGGHPGGEDQSQPTVHAWVSA